MTNKDSRKHRDGGQKTQSQKAKRVGLEGKLRREKHARKHTASASAADE